MSVRASLAVIAVITVAGACALAPAAGAAGVAPGSPGASANWTTGNKQGLGTATTRASKVWYTLSGGALSEVYFPRGDRANVRSLEFAVTDGSSFVDRESEDTTHEVELADPRSLTYRQVNTAKSGRYRITKTYVTDTLRNTVLMRVTFEPLVAGDYRLFTLYDPALANSSRHDTASRAGAGNDVALLASDDAVASALVASPGFTRTSSGFVGTSDGWTDLEDNRQLDWDYDSAPDGNVLQTGELPVGAGTSTFTLALGFADSATAAASVARASLARPFGVRAEAYRDGWHAYMDSLRPDGGSATAAASAVRRRKAAKFVLRRLRPLPASARGRRSLPGPGPGREPAWTARRDRSADVQPAPDAQGEARLVRASGPSERQAHQRRAQPALRGAGARAQERPGRSLLLPRLRAAGQRHRARQLPLATHARHATGRSAGAGAGPGWHAAAGPLPARVAARGPVRHRAQRRSAHAVRRVGHDGQGARGQDLSGCLHRLADAAVGLQRERRRGRWRLPLRVGTRPLPAGDRHARRRAIAQPPTGR